MSNATPDNKEKRSTAGLINPRSRIFVVYFDKIIPANIPGNNSNESNSSVTPKRSIITSIISEIMVPITKILDKVPRNAGPFKY
jgi:hypothetical protein